MGGVQAGLLIPRAVPLAEFKACDTDFERTGERNASICWSVVEGLMFFSLSFSLSFENSFSLQCGFLTATGLGSFSRKAKGSLVDIFIVSRFGRSRGMILECYKHRKRGRYPHNRSYEVREYTIPHHIRF